MRRDLWIGVVAGLLVVAGAAYLIQREENVSARLAKQSPLVTPPGQFPTAPPSVPAGSSASSGNGSMGPGAVAGSGPSSLNSVPRVGSLGVAPWLTDRPAAETSSPAPGIVVGKQGAPTLESIQQRLQGIAASGQPNVRELDQALADLQRNQGRDVIGGVNLQILRDTLMRSERISELAEQIKIVAASPGPDTQKRLQPLLLEIQRVQAGMQAASAVPSASALQVAPVLTPAVPAGPGSVR